MFGCKAIIVGVVVAGAAAVPLLDRRLSRATRASNRSYQDLKAEFQSWLSIYNATITFALGIASAAWLLLFLGLKKLVAGHLPAATFTFIPAWMVLALPAVFLGILTAVHPHEVLMRRLLKERYPDFWCFVRVSRYKRDPREPRFAEDQRQERTATVIMMPLVAAAALVSVCLTLDAYAYFTPSEIVVNLFFGFQDRHYRYDEVKSTHTKLEGRRHNQLNCVIEFEDGSSFSTDAPPAGTTNAEAEALRRFVSGRSVDR